MKLSRRGKHTKHARCGKHTKRAGKHLRYKSKSKKFSGSKRYHRGGNRYTKKLYRRRVKKGGGVTFDVTMTITEDSNNPSITNYTIKGNTDDTITYKKIGALSVTSGKSQFNIEIKSTDKDAKSNIENYVGANIIFTRVNPPVVTYTMSYDNLRHIIFYLNSGGSKPEIEGINTVDNTKANYDFSFKENLDNFNIIKNKVDEIKKKIISDFNKKNDKKKSDTEQKVTDIKKNIEEKIKADTELKINIGLGFEDEIINYQSQILDLQSIVVKFIDENPSSDKISRLRDINSQISQSLLELLVEAYFYQNYDLDGNKLKEDEKIRNITRQLLNETSYNDLKTELYSIVYP